MTIIKLQTRPYSALLSILGGKKVAVQAEEVVAVQVGRQSVVDFQHVRPGKASKSSQEIDLSQIMAERLQAFCRKYYVDGRGNFDCRTFMLYMMGREDGEITKNRVAHGFVGNPMSPNASTIGKPYLIPSPSEEEPPHCIIGVLRAGYSLGVMGVKGPLLIARNDHLARIYNSPVIAEVTSVLPVK